MLVKVSFYGVYRTFLDRSALDVELPVEATARDLLNELSRILGEKFRQRIISEGGGLHSHVNLSVNDRLMRASEIDERLQTGDDPHTRVSVLFVPPMFGGA